MSFDEGQVQDDLSSILIIDDEDVAFLTSLHQEESNQPISTDASHEIISGRDAGALPVDISRFDIRPLFWDDQLVRIPARIRNVCRNAGITTFGELLSVDLTTLPGIGKGSIESINYFFTKCADLALSIRLPPLCTTEPIRRLAGRRDVVWGPFGQLHPLCSPLQEANLDASALIAGSKPTSPVESNSDGTQGEQEGPVDLEASIDLLDLPEPKLRRLRMNGYHTISDLNEASDERLLSIRGLGRGSLNRIRSAIRHYRKLTGIGEQRGPNHERDAIARTSRSNQMSLEESGLPIALSRILNRNDYHTVGDLATAGVNQLSSIKGLGAQKLEIIRQVLDRYTEIIADQSAFSNEASHIADETKRLLENSGFLVPDQPYRAWALPIAQTLINRGEGNATSLIAQLKTIEEPRTSSDALLTLDDWIDQLEQQGGTSNYLLDRLAGLTLEEIGIEAGLTRERIRQITEKELANRPPLAEERYLPLISRYKIDEKTFCQAFDEPPRVYGFLCLVRGRGERLSLEDALTDPDIDVSQRRALADCLRSDQVTVGSHMVPKKKADIAYSVFSILASDRSVKPEEFFDAYQEVLDKNRLTGKPLAFSDAASAERFLRRQDYCVPTEDKGLRCLILDYGQAQELVDGIDFSRYDGMEISSALILRDYPELMEQFDIRDAYELHFTLRRAKEALGLLELSSCELKRTPTLSFGEGDLRRQQIEQLADELAPIGIDAFCDVYEQRYGNNALSMKATIINEYSTLCKEGVVVPRSTRTLSDEEIALVRDAISHGIRTYDSIESYVAHSTPSERRTAPIGPSALRTAGFTFSGSCVFLPDESPKAVFGALVAQGRLDLEELEPGIASCPEFKGVLNMAHRAHSVIQVSRTLYLSRASLGISPSECEDFIGSVMRFPAATQPFNTRSLRLDGFSHPLLDRVLTDAMADGLLETDNHLRKTSANHVRIFRLGTDPITMPDVIAHLVATYHASTIEDVLGLLEARFGARPSKQNAIATASRCSSFDVTTRTFSLT